MYFLYKRVNVPASNSQMLSKWTKLRIK